MRWHGRRLDDGRDRENRARLAPCGRYAEFGLAGASVVVGAHGARRSVTARDSGFAAALRSKVRGDVRENESLARWSTYRIGGPATVLFPASAEDVAAAVRRADSGGVPWFALGLGSNLLFPDAGLDALVIRIGKGLDQITQRNDEWVIGAGAPAPLAAKRTAAAGWAGIHKMVGVPGSVGGGVVMNAGCHGAEWRDVVRSVHTIDRQGNDHIVAAAEVGFSYRRSDLGHVVVVSTTVGLRQEDAVTLEEETESLYRWRKEGTPFNQPCCGSVFKNPVLDKDRDPALPRTSGQFIEATGLKGLRVGSAEVSPMHANYFINTGDATASNVVELMRTVRSRVQDQWDVTLEPEVKLIRADGTVGGLDS
jgi:UDP-N-acetylmuramate dehydrogenase